MRPGIVALEEHTRGPVDPTPDDPAERSTKITITGNFFAVASGSVNGFTENGSTFRLGNNEVVLDRLLIMPLATATERGIVRWNAELRQHELVERATASYEGEF